MSVIQSWKGAPWLAEQMAKAGFGVSAIAEDVFVSEARARGMLSSVEDYDRFWTELADEFVRKGFRLGRREDGYRSQYIDGLLAGQDLHTFLRANPGLSGGVEAFPIEIQHDYRTRIRRAVDDRKANEAARPEVAALAPLMDRGPKAVLQVLAAELGLEMTTGRKIGIKVDGPCLLGEPANGVRPLLFWESGRSWRAHGSLSMACGVQVGCEVRFGAEAIHRGLRWYSTGTSNGEAALGLAAHARFVVELAAALNDGEGTGEAP